MDGVRGGRLNGREIVGHPSRTEVTPTVTEQKTELSFLEICALSGHGKWRFGNCWRIGSFSPTFPEGKSDYQGIGGSGVD
jgi:hypothetical protein